jgi:hypothetical protein
MTAFVEYEDLDDDQLFAKIGADILGQGLNAVATSRRRLVAIGQEWYQEKLVELRTLVCTEDGKAKFDDDHTKWAMAIGPIIGVNFHLDSTAYWAVCILIMRTGLDQYCLGGC